jgi:RNA polymerase sigma-70 factor (ECF subfamily)
MEDNKLVDQAQKGDREAFELIVKRYEQKVFHLAYGFVQDRAAADDLAQEVFIKAYFSLPKFRYESGFGTWLYRITVNHIKDFLRKTARKKEVPLEEFEEGLFALDDETRKKEEEQTKERKRKVVLRVLQALPQKYQMILTLRDIRGFSYDEIADVLKISPGTVDSRLHRARKILRKKMVPYLGAEGGGV